MSIRLNEIERSRQNPHFAAALESLNEFVEYCRLLEVGDEARTALEGIKPLTAPESPLDVSNVSVASWLDAAADYRSALADHEYRRGALITLVERCETRCEYLVTRSSGAITRNLNEQLGTMMATVVAHVEKLDGATSAEQAIENGPSASAAWKSLRKLTEEYDSLRSAQHIIFSALDKPELLHQYQSRYSSDRLANRFWLENLDEVWPDWNTPEQRNFLQGAPPRREPWPEGRVEQLIWLATSSARPWIPTPAQLRNDDAEKRELAQLQARDAHEARKHRRGRPRVIEPLSPTGMVSR